MKKVLVTIIVVLLVQALVALIVMYSGLYNISVLNHDNGVVNWALDTGMTHSVKRHAKGIQAPDLSGPALAQMGAGHYKAMCIYCHGAPGVKKDEIADGLWPEAPDLAETVPEWSAAELYWITKNGIKFTAMPAWGPSHSEDELWQIVAFLKALPKLNAEGYKQMAAKAPAHEE